MNKQEIITILHSKDVELIAKFMVSTPAFQLEAVLYNKKVIDIYNKNKVEMENKWEEIISDYYGLQHLAEKLFVSVSDLQVIDNFEIDSIGLLSDEIIDAYQNYLEYLIDIRRGGVFNVSLDRNIQVELLTIKQLMRMDDKPHYEKAFTITPDFMTQFDTMDKLLKYVNKLSVPEGTDIYINNILLNENQYKIKDTYITITEKVVKSLISTKNNKIQNGGLLQV